MTHKTVRAVATRLGDRNAAGLLIACFIVIFTYHSSVPFFYKKISLKEGQVWRESFSKVIVTFVTQGLPSSSSAVLLLMIKSGVYLFPEDRMLASCLYDLMPLPNML